MFRSSPIAVPAQKPLATRPVYPYPYIARYTGKGDPNDAASYVAVKFPVRLVTMLTMPAGTVKP